MSQNLESIPKFACRVCLKRWDLSYNCMLLKLDLLPLTSRRKVFEAGSSQVDLNLINIPRVHMGQV